jgi:Asp-tRNA(Asn)/Glu-tRNA(Gln) amidotransferase A subunit family amidase
MARLVAADMRERPDAFDPWTLEVLRRGRDMGAMDVDLIPFRVAWQRTFESCDVVAVPTLPAVPPPIAEHKVDLPSGPAVADLAQYALNAPMNTGGVPALAVPCGEVEGMPVAMTLVAPQGAEDVLFAVGQRLEDVLDGAYRDRVATS